jgi:hypothetical protein
MDTQRCQNHGLVRLLVPLLEFNLRSKHEPVRITACAFVETRRHSGSEPGVSSFTVPVRDGSHATKVVSRTNWRNGILLRILASRLNYRDGLALCAMAAHQQRQQTGNKHHTADDCQRAAVAPCSLADASY